MPSESRRGFKVDKLPDLWLAGTAFALVVIGLLMVYSASSPMALRTFDDPTHYLLRSGLYALVGTMVLVSVSRLSISAIRLTGRIGFWVALALLVLVLIPGVGLVGGGARRWIHVGVVTFQPSEVFKVMFVLYVAHIVAQDPDRVRRIKGGLLPLITVFVLAASLLMAEPDFGATVILAVVLFGIVFVAGISITWIALLLLAALPAAAVGILWTPYRLKRVVSFLDPWDDPLKSDFQLGQSLLSFGKGGLLGAGLGQGQQKQFYLPESHTDFILAVIGEEMGLVAVLMLIMLFAFLTGRALTVARRSREPFVRYAAFGLALLIGVQALANMGVVMGLLPPKGLTLPLISYGGSSLVVTMGAVGLLLAFSRESIEKSGRFR